MARLQRKDLAKEFEDIVKQEIKNHNDSVAANNEAINQMRQQIKDLKEGYSAADATIGSVVSTHSSQLLEMSSVMQRLSSHVLSRLNDLGESTNLKIEDVKKGAATRESYYLTVNDFDQFRVKIDEWVSQIRRLFEMHQCNLSQEISKAALSHEKPLAEYEDRWKSHVNYLLKDIEDINKSMDSFGSQFAALKLEIERLKKGCFVIEKNIENLYTQIERLKAEK